MTFSIPGHKLPDEVPYAELESYRTQLVSLLEIIDASLLRREHSRDTNVYFVVNYEGKEYSSRTFDGVYEQLKYLTGGNDLEYWSYQIKRFYL